MTNRKIRSEMANANVRAALRRGDLQPLAALLCDLDLDLSDFTRLTLAAMIVGDAGQSDYRISVGTHPGHGHGKRTRAFASAQAKNELRTLLSLVANGVESNVEAAVRATMAETRQSERTVRAHWASRKRLLRFHRARRRSTD